MSEEGSLVELVELLMSIDINSPDAEENAYVIYDSEGRKILL